MSKSKCEVAQRAWNTLRLSMSWARKRGMFNRRAFGVGLRLVRKFIKRIGYSTPRLRPHYAERQFSFDETPIFHVKMRRPAAMRFDLPRIPCINPKVDFDFEFESYVNDEDGRLWGSDDSFPEEKDGIDLRAEKFISKFYEQMKMQSQISYLQYNEISDE